VHGQVRIGVRAALQGPHDQRSLGVVGRCRRAQPALVDKRLDQGVVTGDLIQVAISQQVSAGVADMANRDLGTGPQQSGQGRTHALHSRVGHAHVMQRVASGGNGRRQRVEHVVAVGEILPV
jgi:hypothetical protein